MRAHRVLVVVLLLAACGGGEDGAAPEAPTPCEEAVAEAASADEMADAEADIEPAFTACGDFEEFATAAEAGGVLNGVDPETYAGNQCQYNPAVSDSPVCASL